MTSLTLFLEPNYEKISQDIPNNVKEAFSSLDKSFFMQHQIDTYKANQNNDIVINTYPTGTGKTIASLLHILDKPYDNVLFIAPTNELISQHCKDISNFINDMKLTHNVIEINAKILKQITDNSEIQRKGEAFYRLLTNPLSEGFIDFLDIEKDKIDYSAPYILVTNPDIFYYSIIFAYGNNDKRNIFHEMFTKFDYIVIDEFHYYNSKQLSCFLFFFTLSMKFGYFKDNKRKITILTATPLPEVLNYFERLAKEGLKYDILVPERIEEKDHNSIKALSKIKLTFYSSDESFVNKINHYLPLIKNNISELKDGAIISNSLININDTKNLLTNNRINDFGLITGVTDKEDKKVSKDKNLILATPTVDIGYNFDKNKDRQNIDYLIFDYKYEDQFWQRLGRAGRVLSKNIKDISSEVIVFTDADTIAKFKNVFNEHECISRQRLAIETNKFLKKREDLYSYIESYGISEMSKPLEEIKALFSKDKSAIITKDLFESLSTVFTGKTNSYYYKVQKFYKRFISLEKSLKDINQASDILEEFKSFYSENNRADLMDRKTLENFIKEEYFTIKGLYNFRESFQGITTLVYDPKTLMGFNSEKFFSYDLFHLLKYYDLNFFSSKSEFLKLSKSKYLDYKEDFFCEIIDRTEENQSIVFNHISELDEDLFEKKYVNKLVAKNNIDFNICINKKTGKIIKTGDLRLDKAKNIFKEKYIPCLIINHLLKAECFKNNIIPIDFNVRFSNGFKKDYSIILGTNAYLLASIPKVKIIEYLTNKLKYYEC